MSVSEDAITDLVDRIYDLPLQPEGWGDMATGLEGLVRGRVAVLVQSDASIGFLLPCSAAGSPDVDDYLERFWQTDRAMSRLRDAAPGATVIDSRLVSDTERERVAFYRDYLRPRGLHRGCYTVLSRHRAQSLIMGVHRPDSRDDFGDECLKVLERVRPHLARSLSVVRRMTEERAARDAAAAALGQTGWGMILVAADGTVRFANAGGEACLEGPALRVRAGRLDAVDARSGRELKSAVARAARRSGGEATFLSVPTPTGELRVSVSPARNGGRGARSEPLAVVLIAESRNAPEESRLRREYGLTPSEARLLRALVGGERLADYADRAGVRLTTAKTHLGSVFAKTGVRRQAELIRLALADPALRLHLADAPPEHDWGGPQRVIRAA